MPSVPGGHLGAGRDVASLVQAMTLEEKASLTVGVGNWHSAAVPRLGIPAVKLTDGPNGARGMTSDHLSVTPSLSTPTGSALGATWDPALVSRCAAAIARQARDKGARVLLAPTVNLHRHPLWGRNFEAFSEDPFLSGALGAGFISGAQGEGVIATVKHLVCNETEHERRMCSSEVDGRTLRELYLLPFEMAVRLAHVRAVMTGYNRLNGEYVADSTHLIADVLRGEWGFEGIVMTDWNALAETAAAGRSGLDLEMPGPGRAFGAPLAHAVEQGRVSSADLDAKVSRLLSTFASCGALDDPQGQDEAPMDRPADRELLHQAAADAIVLLSNDEALPLASGRPMRVALVGPGAERLAVMGGGSARVLPHYQLSLSDALRSRLGPQAELVVAPGCQLPHGASAWSRPEADSGAQAAGAQPRGAQGDDGAQAAGARADDGAGGGADDALLAQAVEAAAGADVAIVVVGTNEMVESESYDRLDMALPGRQVELVTKVLAANKRTVVAVNSGAPVDLAFARDAAALLQVWFGGQELAHALADVLVGASEPGGRLPFTLPLRLEHAPAFGNFPAESGAVRYGEGLLIGYRWYEARHLPVLFPFGHGLSYTQFRVGPARASTHRLGRGSCVVVEVEVQNTGPRPGSQVVQAYVAPPGGGCRTAGGRLHPLKQLKAFQKAHLGPGESCTVRLELNERSFAYYDVADEAWPAIMERYGGRDPDNSARSPHRQQAGWYVDGGTYQVLVGTSSADTPIEVEIEVEGSEGPLAPDAPVG